MAFFPSKEGACVLPSPLSKSPLKNWKKKMKKKKKKKKSISPPGCLGRMPAKNRVPPVPKAEPGGCQALMFLMLLLPAPLSIPFVPPAQPPGLRAQNSPGARGRWCLRGSRCCLLKTNAIKPAVWRCSWMRVCQRSLSFSKFPWGPWHEELFIPLQREGEVLPIALFFWGSCCSW